MVVALASTTKPHNHANKKDVRMVATISDGLTLEHAETSAAYLPHPVDPRWSEAQRVAIEINKTKVLDPRTGERIFDPLVDSLVANMLTLAKEHENAPEPSEWTPPQRCVWRSAKKLPDDRRWSIVHDRSLHPDIKAFVVVRQGRWLVTCPFPGCNGAQLASVWDRRFFCVDCLNRAVENQWIDVVWPTDPAAVEKWLWQRPVHAKNWDIGETEADVKEQDAQALRHNRTDNSSVMTGTVA
jgi:hypothetical protein